MRLVLAMAVILPHARVGSLAVVTMVSGGDRACRGLAVQPGHGGVEGQQRAAPGRRGWWPVFAGSGSGVRGPGSGGGSREEGQGEHGQGGEPVPRRPAADLVMVEADLALGCLERFLNCPAAARDAYQGG